MARRPALNPFWIALVIGVAVRLTLLLTSIGTNDVPFTILWARLARQFGVAGAYAQMWELNHPPLSLLLMHWYDLLAVRFGVEYSDVLRLAQVASDLVTAWALLWIGKREPEGRLPAILYLLLPATIFISGFHCNTDSMMVALMTVGVLTHRRGAHFLAGVFFGLSFGIKIVALFAFPFALAIPAHRRERAKLIWGFVLTVSLILIPATLRGGSAVLRNVFGYSGFSGKWGVPALLLTLEEWLTEPRTTAIYRIAVWYAENGKYVVLAGLAALWIVFVRRYGGSGNHRALLRVIPVAFLVLLFLAPGFGVQYLLWPLPLLPFALSRKTYAATAIAISAYLFMTYTIWSGGFPWWYADSIAASPWKSLVTWLGIPLWLWLGMVAALSLREQLFRPAAASPEPAASCRT